MVDAERAEDIVWRLDISRIVKRLQAGGVNAGPFCGQLFALFVTCAFKRHFWKRGGQRLHRFERFLYLSTRSPNAVSTIAL